MGFTLMEVVITAVIISFGFALLLRVLSMAMSADKYLEYRITALNLANEKMEDIKNSAFASIGSSSESASSVGFAFIKERRTTVSLVDGDGNGSEDQDLKKVDVEVSWTQKGAQHKVKLEILVCNY